MIFDYEVSLRIKIRYSSVDPWFLICSEELDYVVLKLKMGLHQHVDSVLLNRLIHIIGHPKGMIKLSDAGVMILQ